MALLCLACGTAALAGDLVVVVNPANPANALAHHEVADMFLGKRHHWVDGTPVETCDLSERGITEENTSLAQFAGQFLHKDLFMLKNYWIKQIFAGKGQPPVLLDNPQKVRRFVADHAGGIGYLPAWAVTGEVKPVEVRGDD